MSARVRFVAEYMYPGLFFPESTTREVTAPTWEAVCASGPDETDYFKKDRWYAARVIRVVEKRFVADDGEETWVRQRETRDVWSVIVGDLIHVDDIPERDPETGRDQSILRSNIKGNSRDPQRGYGVLTRCGNWQIASDYSEVKSA